jgi:hypothetical protein
VPDPENFPPHSRVKNGPKEHFFETEKYMVYEFIMEPIYSVV